MLTLFIFRQSNKHLKLNYLSYDLRDYYDLNLIKKKIK
jgi:hypothetical protein